MDTLNINFAEITKMYNQQIKNAVIEAVRSYEEPFSDTDIMLLEGLYRIFNDAEFESKHPRDEKGRFATSGAHKPSQAYTEILDKIKQSNDHKITPQDVIKSAAKAYGLNINEVNYHIKRAEEHTAKLIKDNSFTNVIHKQNGEYTEERQKKHDEILADIFANADNARPKDGEKPTVIFLGGRGGSGKSKFDMPNKKKPR